MMLEWGLDRGSKVHFHLFSRGSVWLVQMSLLPQRGFWETLCSVSQICPNIRISWCLFKKKDFWASLICYSESLLVHRTCQALKKSGWEKQRSLGTSQAYGGDAPVISIWQNTQDDKDRHRLLCKNKRGALPETGAQEAPSEHVTTEQDFGYEEKRLTRARR